MPKRTIAAAKVLPHVRPCLWGILAALPAYALAGGLPPMTVDTTFPTPFLVWPYRCFGLYLGSFEWPTPVLSAGGCMAGVFMGLTDLGLVWAAAHWGAGLAVTLRRLPLVAARLVLGLAGYCLAAAGYALLGFIPASLCVGPLEAFSLPDRAVFGISGSLVMVVFLPLFWLYPLRWATRACLEDFAWFDRLAMDSSEGWEREPGTVWQAWWDDSARP